MSGHGRSLRVGLLGKKHWSVKALDHLLVIGCDVPWAVARPAELELDRAQGTLAEACTERDIPLLDPAEMYERAAAGEIEADLVVSYLFWERLREPVLSMAPLGAINLHPAPLPDLRGLGGYNAAILDGWSEYGVSAHYMASTIDTGDVIGVRRFPMDPDRDTARSLEARSMRELLVLFCDLMDAAVAGETWPRQPQEPDAGRYLDRAWFERERRAMLDEPPDRLERRCRAFFFPPQAGAYVEVDGREFTLVTDGMLDDLARELE